MRRGRRPPPPPQAAPDAKAAWRVGVSVCTPLAVCVGAHLLLNAVVSAHAGGKEKTDKLQTTPAISPTLQPLGLAQSPAHSCFKKLSF